MVQNLTTLAPGLVQGEADETAIRRTVQDYIEGWNDGDSARMERSLHPQLVKRWVTAAPSSAWPPGDRLDEMSALRLVQSTRRDPAAAQPRSDAWPAQTTVTILDRVANAASVKIWGDADGDYAHLARWNGQWVIVNVLFVPPTPRATLPTDGPDDMDAAILRTARDYNESWDEGDAARVERSLHPHLAKRTVVPNAGPLGDRLDEMSALRLMQLTQQEDPTPVDERVSTDVTILDRVANAASVKIGTTEYLDDYLHLALWNGRWVIVNALWEPRP